MPEKKNVELRVAGGSSATKVAGALVKYIEEGEEVSLLAIGAGAVNQMVKSVAIARGLVAMKGLDLFCKIGFADEKIEGNLKTAIRIRVSVS